ncbi:MAG: lactonase family protein [Planctomyces sp.]|nr:lactonase family protein [Planctomyces sp.]
MVSVILGGMMSSVEAQQFRVFVGTYTGDGSISRGIYTSVFDASKGTLSEPVLAAESESPSFLALHPGGGFLYAVNEVVEGSGRANGRVSSYRIQPDGTLVFLNVQQSFGGAPCHCNVDAGGKFLLVANYIGGNVVVYPLNSDGSLGSAVTNVWHSGEGVDKSRQEAAHAHSINLSADNRFAYAADLGIDRIVTYQFDDKTGALKGANGVSTVVISERNPDGSEKRMFSTAAAEVTKGGGPRHFALHPRGLFAYSNNELTATVTAFSRNEATGELTRIQELSTLPADFTGLKSTAECLVDPTGRYLYVSNRGHDSIAAYAIDGETGKLTLMEITSTGGQEPRNFVIDPTGRWLLAENQNSDSVIVFRLEDGRLKSTDNRIQVGKPVCIRMKLK